MPTAIPASNPYPPIGPAQPQGVGQQLLTLPTYSTDSYGNVTGLVGPSGKNLGFAKGALTQIRQRDRLLLNNNGALIAAGVFQGTHAYVGGQFVQYSATNPSLIGCCGSGTSGATLAAYTSAISMSDGTLNWAPSGRISCGQAAASNLATSLYKENWNRKRRFLLRHRWHPSNAFRPRIHIAAHGAAD